MKHVNNTILVTTILTIFAQTKDVWTQAESVNTDQVCSKYIEHVQQSISNALKGKSQLTPSILQLRGLSSAHVRHFLNNLCSLPGAKYLEIGCWRGSTLISALYGNGQSINKAFAFDNWTDCCDHTVRPDFLRNTQTYIPGYPLQFFEKNCFSANKQHIFKDDKIDIYFYDGDHTNKAHEEALTYFSSVLADVCIVIIDDWNWPGVREATQIGFKKIDYDIAYQQEFFTSGNDANSWWNGLYIAVIVRK